MTTSTPRASGELANLARLLGERAGVTGPSSWLIENADLLPPVPSPGTPAGALPAQAQRPRALDVACGSGRHALLLAAAGFEVLAIDRDAAAIEALRAAAGRLGLTLRAEVRDLEARDRESGGAGHGSIAGPLEVAGPSTYDVILVVHYLHRPLFPALVSALAPEGLLLYETFTVDQAARGHPKNPDFLLKHGELPGLVAPLAIVRQREGEFDGRFVAAVAAVRSRS
ncbi:MAG TPA: methyltransferase domain-containing protein [Candidatus Polarisedimenticolia bacterium]|nr:methyltransferase domain-containing protein [Candidatus Polarisedimenticolia bacterium]